MKEYNNVILHREKLKSIPDDILNFVKTYDKKNILKRYNEDKNYKGIRCSDISIVYTETEIWYSDTTYMVTNTASPYLKTRNKFGFTYNIKTKKIKFWLNSNITNCIHFFRKKYNFIDEQLLTNTTCAGLISGEIKNLYQLCEIYIKANKLSCKPKNLYECVKEGKFNKNIFLYLCKSSYDTQDDILINMLSNNTCNTNINSFDMFSIKTSSSHLPKKLELKCDKILSAMILASIKHENIVSEDVYLKHPYESSENVVYIYTNTHLEIICDKYGINNQNDFIYGFECIYENAPTLCLVYESKIRVKSTSINAVKNLNIF